MVPIQAPEVNPRQDPIKPKWVDIAAPTSNASVSSRMNLTYYPPQLCDSNVVVCPPQDVVNLVSELWTDCVIGYFLDKKVHFPIVRSMLRGYGRSLASMMY